MMKTNKKGISLIVLIITILVMIILAAAIILNLDDTKIIGNADRAVAESNMAIAKELRVVAKAEWRTNQSELKKQYNSFDAYLTSKLENAGLDNFKVKNETLNMIYTDDGGNKAIIPEGFSLSTVESERTVDTGLVIKDVEGNEFVWVPVDDMDLFKRTTTYTGTTITDPGSNYSEPYKELSLSNDPTGEVAEYTAMKASVEENKGFYIARYEAGKEGTDTVVSKKGATVWTNIPWGTSMTEIGTQGAVYRSRQMYKGSKSVVSTLCYSVQWDAALRFIATKDATYPTDSTGKGYYAYDSNNNLIEGMEAAVQPTGYYAVNNIYDMAGNVSEWTMEASSSNYRVLRGGYYNHRGSGSPASDRYRNGPGYAYVSCGFRLTLYIK